MIFFSKEIGTHRTRSPLDWIAQAPCTRGRIFVCFALERHGYIPQNTAEPAYSTATQNQPWIDDSQDETAVARIFLSFEAISRGASRGHGTVSFTAGAVFCLVPLSFLVSNRESVEDVQSLHLHRKHVRALYLRRLRGPREGKRRWGIRAAP